MQYEVFGSRFDISPERLGSFQADNDEEANKVFYEKYVGDPNYAWERLSMVEVVQERKVRTVTTR